MHHRNTASLSPPRKVRLWPSLRLEICGQNAAAQLTPDEALGLANHLILEAREAVFQAGKTTQRTAIPCSGLVARATPDCVTLSLWQQGTELVATLSPVQSENLAKTIASKSGALQIIGAVNQFSYPFTP